MTPYRVYEFYDTDDSPPEEQQDDASEYIWVNNVDQNSGKMPIPTAEEPYLYGFEVVFYGKEGYEYNHPEFIYDNTTKKYNENALASEEKDHDNNTLSDKDLEEKGLIKWVASPISLVSKIGAGSFTEQLYKYVAKGLSTTDGPSNKVLEVPSDDMGSYTNPAPPDSSPDVK